MRSIYSVLTLGIALAACSSDSPTDSGDPPATNELSDAEFEDLAEVLAILADLGFTGAFGSPPAGVAAVSETFTIDPTAVSCPLGGTVLFSGSVTADDETGSVSLDFSQTYNGCSAAAPSSSRMFVLDGPLSYDFLFQIISDEVATFSLNQAGALSWSTSGKSGTCQMNITLVSTVNVTTFSGTGTVSGSLCGRTASETVQF